VSGRRHFLEMTSQIRCDLSADLFLESCLFTSPLDIHVALLKEVQQQIAGVWALARRETSWLATDSP
jgi:hypothetical protein